MKHLKSHFPDATLLHYQPPAEYQGFKRFRHCEEHCRKMVRKYALENDFDYLFFLDSDIICNRDVIKKLLSHDKDIACGLFFYRDPPTGRPLWFKKKIPVSISSKTRVWFIDFVSNKALEENGDKLMEIDACGFGAILIKREALEKVLFHKSPNDHYGVDIHFCFDSKLLGYRIFGDPTAKCKHLYEQCSRRRKSNALAF